MNREFKNSMNTKTCINGHKMTGIGFDDLCPECDDPWEDNPKMKKDPNKTRNGDVLKDFIEYCMRHPNERFWQALRNWSEADYIMHVKSLPESNDVGSNEEIDTFYWENKNN